MTLTVDRLLSDARDRLSRAPHRPSGREALLLLASALELRETDLLAHPERPVDGEDASRFERLLRRRLGGEPIAYILGEKEFFGRPFRVDGRVLIPRPESEHLIEEALRLRLPGNPLILDLGTGSGCLAATAAAEIPGARVLAVDRSLGALALARENFARLETAGRTLPLAADFASPLRLQRVDLVISNPPYIEPREKSRLSPEILDFEPAEALMATESFGALLSRLLETIRPLRSGTPVLLEIGQGQLRQVRLVAREKEFELVRSRTDYSGIPRVVSLVRC